LRKYDYSDLVSLTEAEKEIIDSNGLPLMIPRRYEAEIEFPELLEDFDWQITYSFPSDLHNNVTGLGKIYGGETVTYRRLYLILCEAFNNGEFFVDEYFNGDPAASAI
jgi:hypothetical protein